LLALAEAGVGQIPCFGYDFVFLTKKRNSQDFVLGCTDFAAWPKPTSGKVCGSAKFGFAFKTNYKQMYFSHQSLVWARFVFRVSAELIVHAGQSQHLPKFAFWRNLMSRFAQNLHGANVMFRRNLFQDGAHFVFRRNRFCIFAKINIWQSLRFGEI